MRKVPLAEVQSVVGENLQKNRAPVRAREKQKKTEHIEAAPG